MRHAKKVVMSLVLTIAMSCSDSPSVAVPIDFDGKTVVFIGDSITAGSSATSNSLRWTTLFCAAKGATEVNMGIGGQVLQAGTSGYTRTVFDPTTIPAYNSSTHAALFIVLGTNDIGCNNATFTPAGYQTRMGEVIDYATGTKGWPASRIVIGAPYYMTTQGYEMYVTSDGVTAADVTRHEAYVAAAQSAAQSKGACYVDFYTPMKNYSDPASLIDPADGIHPNNTGHAFINDIAVGASYTP